MKQVDLGELIHRLNQRNRIAPFGAGVTKSQLLPRWREPSNPS